MLDRTVGKPEDQDQDNQLNQFVPDLNVVGKSSTLGQVCVRATTLMSPLRPKLESLKKKFTHFHRIM